MCGRFTLRPNPHEFAEIFAVVRGLKEEWQASYNIAPTQTGDEKIGPVGLEPTTKGL